MVQVSVWLRNIIAHATLVCFIYDLKRSTGLIDIS